MLLVVHNPYKHVDISRMLVKHGFPQGSEDFRGLHNKLALVSLSWMLVECFWKTEMDIGVYVCVTGVEPGPHLC
jgi:hypothetical protein